MMSGRPLALTLPRVLRVFVSKTVALESPPLLVNPRPRSGTKAMPWTPGVSAISPTTFSVSRSTTITRLPRVT